MREGCVCMCVGGRYVEGMCEGRGVGCVCMWKGMHVVP